jgi:hypothetical protein
LGFTAVAVVAVQPVGVLDARNRVDDRDSTKARWAWRWWGCLNKEFGDQWLRYGNPPI